MKFGKKVMWEKIVEKLKEKAKEGRELCYSPGAIGITALLYCPKKWELRQKHPEVQATGVEIDDGFIWEKQVKEVLKEIFPDGFEEEKTLKFEMEGVKLEGHLDAFIELEDKVIGIELKSPKYILLKEFPETQDDVLFDDGKIVFMNDIYVLQARIQYFLLKKLYPHKEVEQYIFAKALCRKGNLSKKFYVVYRVKEPVSEEELRQLIKRFKEDKSPRFPKECEYYCEFYRQKLCSGEEFRGKSNDMGSSHENVKELLKTYRQLQSDLKNLELQLKKSLRGSLKVGNREIGWVKKKVIKLNTSKILNLLPRDRIPQFFQLKSGAAERLIQIFGKEIVEKEEEKLFWRL